MKPETMRRMGVAAAVLLAGFAAQAAHAATCTGLMGLPPMCLTDTVIWNGTAATVGGDPYGAATAVNSVTPTSSYFLGDAFNPGVYDPIQGNFPLSVAWDNGSGTPPAHVGGPWNFYDNFVFNLTTSSNVQGVVASFVNGVVGISNLEARVIELTPAGSSPIATNGAYDALAPNQLGNPPMGATTVVDAWKPSELGSSGFYNVMLNQSPLSSGEYVLQIRGEVAYSTQSPTGYDGSYSGTLSFVTPLPPGMSLLISGLAGLVAWLRWGPVRVLRPAWVA
jgi:hypothetical protein